MGSFALHSDRRRVFEWKEATGGGTLTFTVPDGEFWKIQQLTARFITAATPATARRLSVRVQNNDLSINYARFSAGVTQAANVERYYCFGSVGQETAFGPANSLRVQMAQLILGPGARLTIIDHVQVNLGGDALAVALGVEIERVQ